MSNRLRASLIGGGVMGGLSVLTVVPQLPFIRIICCIWAIVGGALAAYLYVKKSPTPAGVGDGAVVGTLAGVFGALIAFAAFLLVSFYISDRTIYEEQIRRAGLSPEQFSYPVIIFLVGSLSIIVQIVLSLVGGIIGVSIFENRGDGGTGSQLPPPPPHYDGTPGEAYAAPLPPPTDTYGPEA
ncbi:MAG TPA: DUF5518 domain-containing protein [Pyrinomonadaceae bacterium]|jgi:hypothetical protein|nr:DUF5518 domain-containing protein [Pyrinomonadaceae bacterium]